MEIDDITWSDTEKKVAQAAFDKAYKREISALIEEVRNQAGALVTIDDLWRLHDFLSARRHDIDGKYDYQYGELIFTFASLVKDGWLEIKELDGLDTDKLTKVRVLSLM
jgi:hypothetical protein